MHEDQFDPGEFEHSLAAIADLWAISLVHVGFGRPLHLGPVALHLTLFALVAPFLLAALNRLRHAAAPGVRRPLRAALGAGTLSFASGILWGPVATLVSIGAMVGAVFLFEGAMYRLAADHAAADLARRWQGLRHTTAAAGTLLVPAAVLVLGDAALAGWLAAVLVIPTGALAGYLLVRLAEATRRTRSWLQDLEMETSGPVS